MSDKECPRCDESTHEGSKFCPECGYNYTTRKNYPKSKSGALIGCAIAAGIAFLIVPVVGLLAAIAIPSFMKARITSQQNSCINNLRQIESAKEQWALETGQPGGTAVVDTEVAQYIIGGSAAILCPAGGTVTYNPVGTNARCDHPDADHKLQDY